MLSQHLYSRIANVFTYTHPTPALPSTTPRTPISTPPDLYTNPPHQFSFLFSLNPLISRDNQRCCKPHYSKKKAVQPSTSALLVPASGGRYRSGEWCCVSSSARRDVQCCWGCSITRNEVLRTYLYCVYLSTCTYLITPHIPKLTSSPQHYLLCYHHPSQHSQTQPESPNS